MTTFLLSIYVMGNLQAEAKYVGNAFQKNMENKELEKFINDKY